MPEHPAADDQAHSPDLAIEETDAYVEIVEEGEEAETAGPMPFGAKGRSDLSPTTYWIGRSHVTDDDLGEYVECGLIKASLHGLCRAPGQKEVPNPKPYEAVVFWDFSEAGLRFPYEDFVDEVL